MVTVTRPTLFWDADPATFYSKKTKKKQKTFLPKLWVEEEIDLLGLGKQPVQFADDAGRKGN